jgi:regulator of ribonuclease activity A
MIKTTDLWEQLSEQLQVASSGLQHFGGNRNFCGKVTTLKLYEENQLVRNAVAESSDGGGSLRTVLLGDLLAQKALDHGWSGIIINGSVRDSTELATMPLGVLALGTTPRRSAKEGWGYRDRPVQFLGVTIRPGAWICTDADGWVIAPAPLQPQGE